MKALMLFLVLGLNVVHAQDWKLMCATRPKTLEIFFSGELDQKVEVIHYVSAIREFVIKLTGEKISDESGVFSKTTYKLTGENSNSEQVEGELIVTKFVNYNRDGSTRESYSAKLKYEDHEVNILHCYNHSSPF
jgi:hypothetical protein